jgi:hypothetical protein
MPLETHVRKLGLTVTMKGSVCCRTVDSTVSKPPEDPVFAVTPHGLEHPAHSASLDAV